MTMQFFTVSHRPWKNKVDYIRILLHATVACKITITSAEERKGLLDWGPVWSPWQNEKVDLFCRALFLSLDAFLADKSLCERERRKMNVCAKFQWVWDFFLAVPQQREREGDREWSTSRLKWVKITRCILSKTSLLSLCYCRTMERPGRSYLMEHYASHHCHLTVPSWGAISTSDIKWPLSTFLPVWCHGEEWVTDHHYVCMLWCLHSLGLG